MIYARLSAAVVALTLLWSPSAHADVVDDCEQKFDPDLSIASCTTVIQSGEYAGEDLFRAYFFRGSMYAVRRDFRRVIEDIDQALRLDPALDPYRSSP